MSTWEERMSERAQARRATDYAQQQHLAEIELMHREARIRSVQTFIDGPDPEQGCTPCNHLHPHPWGDSWMWSHSTFEYSPEWRAYWDDNYVLHCNHFCHGPDGYHQAAVAIG